MITLSVYISLLFVFSLCCMEPAPLKDLCCKKFASSIHINQQLRKEWRSLEKSHHNLFQTINAYRDIHLGVNILEKKENIQVFQNPYLFNAAFHQKTFLLLSPSKFHNYFFRNIIGHATFPVVSWLIEHDYCPREALQLAAVENNISVFEELNKKYSEEYKDERFYKECVNLAALRENLSILEQLLQKKPQNISDQSDFGSRPSLKWEKASEIMKLFITYEYCKANGKTAKGTPFLIQAVRRKNLNLIRNLLWGYENNCADINAIDRKKRTALSVALLCARRDPEFIPIVKELCNAGADVNYQHDSNASSPIMCHLDVNIDVDIDRKSLRSGKLPVNPELLNLLLDKGGRLDIRDSKKRTPLMLFLLAHKNEFIIDEKLVKPLCDTKLLQRFIKNSNVNTVDADERSPLHYATQSNEPEAIEQLLKHGAEISIDWQDKDGNTALHYIPGWFTAKTVDKVKSMQLLLQANANCNIKNKHNSTPLHWAARDGNFQQIEMLLSSGADCNIQDEDGDTPLHNLFRQNDPCSFSESARSERIKILKHCINNNADISIKNKEGLRVYDYWNWYDEFQKNGLTFPFEQKSNPTIKRYQKLYRHVILVGIGNLILSGLMLFNQNK